MSSTAQEHSLFEFDRELDTLLDEIEEEIENRGEAPWNTGVLADDGRWVNFEKDLGNEEQRLRHFLRGRVPSGVKLLPDEPEAS